MCFIELLLQLLFPKDWNIPVPAGVLGMWVCVR